MGVMASALAGFCANQIHFILAYVYFWRHETMTEASDQPP